MSKRRTVTSVNVEPITSVSSAHLQTILDAAAKYRVNTVTHIIKPAYARPVEVVTALAPTGVQHYFAFDDSHGTVRRDGISDLIEAFNTI